jgi:hypothetical protein
LRSYWKRRGGNATLNANDKLSIREHVEHLLAARDALMDERDRRYEERDRRYAEVKAEQEKALKIKEEADKVALDLARQIQTYKDNKANELREQISSERGLYASKEDLGAAFRELQTAMKPALDYVTAQRGSKAGIKDAWGYLVALAGLIIAAWALLKQ